MDPRSGLVAGAADRFAGLVSLGLLEPNAGLVAVGEFDAGFFQGALDGFDGARLQCLAGFEAHDGAGRDMGQLRQIADAQFQSGSRHAALGGVHRYNVSNLT